MRASFDVGIISVVSEEARAVVDALQRHPEYREVRGKLTGRIFDEGKMLSSDGYNTVVGVQQLEQGNRSVTLAYEALRQEYDVALVALVGIAGAIHKDIKLCDVVIADNVFYYDKRKVSSEETKHRGEAYKLPAWMKQQINRFFKIHREPALFSAAVGSSEKTFQVLQGPIGSGEAVVGFREAPERLWLTSMNDKTLALETESGGFMQAFHEEQLRDSSTEAVLIIRGISDHADAEKSDRWRQPAADNAINVLEKILGTMPSVRSLLRKE